MDVRLLAAPLLLLGACTATQVETVSRDVQVACADIMPLTEIAMMVPQAAPIAAGVIVGCTTASGLARLAADPSSAVWLGMQGQMLKDFLRRSPIRLS